MSFSIHSRPRGNATDEGHCDRQKGQVDNVMLHTELLIDLFSCPPKTQFVHL